jgi:hypothetical protein
MRILNPVAVLLMAALATGACASTGTRAPGTLGARDASTATVRVTNNNWSNVTVYVVNNGMRVRLGDVTSMQSSTFRVPQALMRATGDLQLLVSPLASNEVYVTPGFTVLPGQEVEFNIENQLTISSLAIWNH